MPACAVILATLAIASATAQPLDDDDGSERRAVVRMRIAREFACRVEAADFSHAVQAFDNALVRVVPAESLRDACNRCASTRPSRAVIKSMGVRYNGRFPERPEDFLSVTANRPEGNVVFEIQFWDDNLICGIHITSESPGHNQGYKAPSYDRTDSYVEVEVEFGRAPWRTRGRLTLPREFTQSYYTEVAVPWSKRAPVIVLIQGLSFARDMDYSQGDVKPFCDIARGLASHGIGVLRYEMRRWGHHGLDMRADESFTLGRWVIDDAVEAVRYLRSHPLVNPNRVYLLGHNIAGALLPSITDRTDGGVAGVVVAGGIARDVFKALKDHLRLPLEEGGTPGGGLMASAIKSWRERALTGQAARRATGVKGFVDFDFHILDQINAQVPDPADSVARFDGPVFIASGDMDTLSSRTDFDAYTAALKKRGDATLRRYPKMGLYMTDVESPAGLMGSMRAGHVSEAFISDLAEWIQSR